VFVSVPVIDVSFVPEAAPVIPETTGADQEYFVPLGKVLPEPSVGVTVNEFPEQITGL
jgi:hypothetical protein